MQSQLPELYQPGEQKVKGGWWCGGGGPGRGKARGEGQRDLGQLNKKGLLCCSQVSNAPGTQWIEEGSSGGLLRLRSMKDTPVQLFSLQDTENGTLKARFRPSLPRNF